MFQKPSNAFVAASWIALLSGVTAFIVGLWNANMELNEKGYYFTVLMFGLYSAVSLQKSVRDRAEGIPVTSIFLGLSWAMVLVSLVLVATGLANSSLALSEKGFYGLGYAMALFSVVAVQKNVRDLAAAAPAPAPAPAVSAQPDVKATVWQ